MILIISRQSYVNVKIQTIANIKGWCSARVDLISDAYYTAIDKRKKRQLARFNDQTPRSFQNKPKFLSTNKSNFVIDTFTFHNPRPRDESQPRYQEANMTGRFDVSLSNRRYLCVRYFAYSEGDSSKKRGVRGETPRTKDRMKNRRREERMKGELSSMKDSNGANTGSQFGSTRRNWKLNSARLSSLAGSSYWSEADRGQSSSGLHRYTYECTVLHVLVCALLHTDVSLHTDGQHLSSLTTDATYEPPTALRRRYLLSSCAYWNAV